jgi:hypothetical protein
MVGGSVVRGFEDGYFMVSGKITCASAALRETAFLRPITQRFNPLKKPFPNTRPNSTPGHGDGTCEGSWAGYRECLGRDDWFY